MDKSTFSVSVIIPVYNEIENIEILQKNIRELRNVLPNVEVIVVNDASTDGSGDALASSASVSDYILISHPYNKGYGASLKTGVAASHSTHVLFFDGDGQHNIADVMRLVKEAGMYDMVIGAREGYKGPLWRAPGKRCILLLANYLVKYKIPDLNSGLRIIRKDLFVKFLHLYPQGFSLTTTVTLTFLKQGYTLKYLPIKVNKRLGKSTVKVRDGFQTINLVIRMIMLFSPLRIFFPASALFAVVGSVSLVNDILHHNLADTTTFLFITAMHVAFFGLLADQMASTRREINL